MFYRMLAILTLNSLHARYIMTPDVQTRFGRSYHYHVFIRRRED